MNFELPPISADFYVRKIGLTMPRERRQQGWVEKRGKKPRVWTGFWHEYVVVDGKEKRRERCKVLGPCAEMTKGAAESKLLETINSSRAPQTGATFEALAAWYLKTNEGRWSVK